MATEAQKRTFEVRAPEKSGKYQVQSTATNTAAASFDWVTPLGTAPVNTYVKLALSAVTNDCYVRFGPTSTTGTTSSNGMILKAGAAEVYVMANPLTHKYIDHLGTVGAGVLKVRIA